MCNNDSISTLTNKIDLEGRFSTCSFSAHLFLCIFILHNLLIVTLTPGNGKIAGDYLDKVAHFVIFFFLSLNICYKYQKHNRLFHFLFLGILFGVATEIIQQYIPGRNMDIIDAVSDAAGVITAYVYYSFFKNQSDLILVKLGA